MQFLGGGLIAVSAIFALQKGRGINAMVAVAPKEQQRMVRSVEDIWKREIGERLTLLASAVGLTNHGIAEELGVGHTNWGNWRRGDIMLPPAYARQLKEKYGCGLDWLYLGDETSNTARFNERLREAIRAAGPRNITLRRAAND